MLMTHNESQRKIYWSQQATVPLPRDIERPIKVSTLPTIMDPPLREKG